MFKKSLASIVTAAILVTGPGNLALTAAAQTMGRAPATGVSVIPTIGTGFNAPAPGGLPSLNTPSLAPSVLVTPSLMAVPSVAAAPVAAAAKPAATPALAAAAQAAPSAAASPLAVIQSRDAEVGAAEKGAALNVLFDNSLAAAPESLAVLGGLAASVENLSRSGPVSAKSPASIERAALQKSAAAGSLSGLGNLIKRAWNAVLGMLGIGVKKLETPAVMAQRIIDQLNSQKPVYNRKVQEASTLVEALKLQVEGETAKVAELERGITALLSDSDASNDIMASGLINQQKTLAASIAASQEQIGLAEATLVSIKEERARFFSEREEMLAKIQAGLTKSAAADIQKQIAELKGGFEVGDLKDNMDRFEDAVNDQVADAKGTADSVDSNPDQILKKAKDALKNQEVQDELARRKAAIEQARKDKGAAGGAVRGALKAVGIGVNVAIAVWAGLNTGWIAALLAASSVMSVVIPLGSIGAIAGGVFAEKVMKTSGAKTAGLALLGGVLGFGLGLAAVGVAGYVGFTVASTTAALVFGGVALASSLLGEAFNYIFKTDKKASVEQAKTDKDAAGGKLARIDPFLTLMGAFYVAINPAPALIIVGMIAAFSFGARAVALRRGQAFSDEFQAGKFVGMGIGGIVGAAIFVAANAFTPFAIITPLAFFAIAGIYKLLARGGNDTTAAGGKIGSYPAAAYILGSVGFAISLMTPFAALAVIGVLGALTLADTLTSAGNLDKSKKFNAFAIGTGAAALITLAVSGFGIPFYLAAGAAVLAGALGRLHKTISDKKSAAGGLLLELGIGAAVIAVIALVSKPFRAILARAWNAALGVFGLGVKKLETPEVMAQRIIDQLNSQKPVYNRKVQEASTLVEKLRLQIEKQTAQSNELDRSVTALLSDSDPLNDVMAESLLNQKKTVDASTVMTQEQLAISEKTLVSIKEERASFFSEREEMLAKIQAGLTKSKAAEIQKQIAELKGGFQVGDLKDNMDRFEDAVNDKVADAKGTADSVDSNPDQILKKAKDSLKNQEVQDELARRKAAIEAARKAKGAAGGGVFEVGAVAAFAALIVAALAFLASNPKKVYVQLVLAVSGLLFPTFIFMMFFF